MLSKILEDPLENELIRFEAAKSLISLGEWSEKACELFSHNLKSGNLNLKLDILSSIASGKNAHFTDLVGVSTKLLLVELLEF
jgi:hypothetical protein